MTTHKTWDPPAVYTVQRYSPEQWATVSKTNRAEKVRRRARKVARCAAAKKVRRLARAASK